MDIFVFIHGILGFFQYIIIKMFLLRLSCGRQVMSRAFLAFIISLEIQLIIWSVSYYYLVFPDFQMNWRLVVIYMFVSLAISVGLITGYIFAVLGTATTSLRVQMLSVIADSGRAGISLREFVSKYNAAVMVRQRLARFTESGEVVRKGDLYYPGYSKTLYIKLSAFILFLNRLYRNDIYRV